MEKNRSNSRGTTFPLVTSGIALLFLVQTLAFVFSMNGRLAFSAGGAGASIAMAGEICHAKPDDGGETPAQPTHQHHCALCSIGKSAHELDVLALIPGVVIVIVLASLSGDGGAPGWSLYDNLPSLPVGWTSSWSSRAPPLFV
jgi:hypothetical protein